jgi:hypothetical protein
MWTHPLEALTVNDLKIEINAAGRAKLDITVRNEEGGIVLTDRATLVTIDGRREMAKDLAGKLRGFGIEKTPAELKQDLQAVWVQFVQQQEKEAAEQAKARQEGDERNPDTREQRRLEAMPQDVREEAEALLKSPRLMKRILDDIETQGVAGEPNWQPTCI